MTKKWIVVGAALAGSAGLLAGCATDEYGNRLPMTEAERGALIGTAVGAAGGALIGSKTGSWGRGALIGAVGGGITGGLVGNYMDRQKKDFEKVLRPELDRGVIRIEKLPQNQLLVGMTGATAFEIDSDVIQPGFYTTLDKIANILNRYGKTQLIIVGHTDNTGSRQHNQQLSERRAAAVDGYLLQRQVIPQRLSAYGRGEEEPIATNATPEGRQRNRRVDITIIPIVAS